VRSASSSSAGRRFHFSSLLTYSTRGSNRTMPALPAVPKVIFIKNVVSVGNDLTAINRFFFQYTGTPPTSVQLGVFAGSISTAWNTNMAPLFPSQSTLTEVDCIDLSSALGGAGSDTTQHIGTRAGNFLAASTAFVLQHHIGRRYRGGHCRTYLAAGVQADLSGRQAWTGAFVTAAVNGWTAYEDAIELAGWAGAGTLDHANVSYYSGFTVITSPTTGRARNVPKLRVAPLVDLVTLTTGNIKPGTQRRRDLQGA
jgi:hypothetical protein